MANKNPKGTKAAEVNSLREAILSFPELKPAEVARRVGCGVSTVYKVRNNPQGDGRQKERKQKRSAARMRWMQEEVEGDLTIDDVLEEEPALLTGIGPMPVVEGDPYADRGYDGYELARATDPTTAAPEVALLRTQIRQTANQIHRPRQTVRGIRELQAHLNEQIATLVKAIKAGRDEPESEHGEMTSTAIEHGWEVQTRGGGPGQGDGGGGGERRRGGRGTTA